MLRLQGLKLPVDHGEDALRDEILKILGIAGEELLAFRVAKRSVDARKKDRVWLIYSADCQVNDEEVLADRIPPPLLIRVEESPYSFQPGARSFQRNPVVVGTGPAGLFAGLMLSSAGYAPILLERGKPVDERIADVENFIDLKKFDPESNVQFGEGGAGTFSDGKLTTLIKDPRCRKVLEELVAVGAPEEILVFNKPHIGTDLLRGVVVALRRKIESLGGTFRWNSKMTDLFVRDGRVTGVTLGSGEVLETTAVILAPGNSARDTFSMLAERGVRLEQKAFSIGLRIEHPQSLVDRSQYGKFAGHPRLGSAEYKLVHHCANGRSVYTFCMCPGGYVIGAASEPDGVVTNGMSRHSRDGMNANSGVLVGIPPSDFGGSGPLAGVEFQREWERQAYVLGGRDHSAPVQMLCDFMKRRPSERLGSVPATYRPGVVPSELDRCLPAYVCEAIRQALPVFDRQLRGFAMPDAVLTGVETRSSCPLRIVRDERGESNIKGLFPCGEGSGYSGGIVSSAVDGIRTAEMCLL